MYRLVRFAAVFIMVLLPIVLWATENQIVTFSGSYSLNNVATDADSAWLYLIYYDTEVDSVKVTAEDRQWDGYYRYAHSCTNDSVAGWSGVWFFFDESESIIVSTVAAVNIGRDSTYALETSVTAVRDSLDECATADVSGLSTFDNTSDSVMVDVSTAGAAGNLIPLTEDAVYANRDDYKADVSALALEASLFDPSSDSVLVDVSAAATAGNLLPEVWAVSTRNLTELDEDNTSIDLDASTVGIVTQVTLVNNIASDGIESTDLTAATYAKIAQYAADSVWDADSSEFMDDNTGHMAYAIQQILDSLDGQSWAGVGGGSDSATNIRWMNHAIWGIRSEDSSTAAQRVTSGGGGCSGTGAYSCTLSVIDTTNDVSVAGALITVNNQTEDGTALIQASNSNGYKVFSLDNGDYRASVYSPPYVFASTDFTIASAALHDSVVGYSPVISSPASPSLAKVYGDFIVGNYDTLSLATVYLELEGVATAIDTNANLIIGPQRIVTSTNTSGHLEISLLKNENLIVTTGGTTLRHPWWKMTVNHSLLSAPLSLKFFMDADSTTFNLGVADTDNIIFETGP